MLCKFGGAQALTESKKTGACLIAGWASRPVLEEISSSWGLGYGIVEAMKGYVLGAAITCVKTKRIN